MIVVTRAQIRDIGAISAHARQIDIAECAAAGMTVKQAIRYGMMHGEVYTVRGEKPMAMFGVVPRSLLTGSASVWLIATDEALKHPREWLTIGREWAAAIIRLYPRAQNRVHKDNKVAIRWLERVGFTVAPARGDDPFREFQPCATPLS